MKTGLPPIVSQQSTILILGTMPGEKSIAAQQYYANRGNHFWKILFMVFDEVFSDDYALRMELLAKHQIALWNVLAACEREGSGDHKIRNARVNDFSRFFKEYPNITHVFFESKAAQQFYDKLAVRAEGISYDFLPSVSGLNARFSFAQKLAAWQTLSEATPVLDGNSTNNQSK